MTSLNATTERGLLAELAEGEHSGSRASVAASCSRLGVHYRTEYRVEQAMAMYRRSLILFEALRERINVAATYRALAELCELAGDMGQSRYFQEEALAISNELGDRNGEAISYGALGFLQQLDGDLESAEWMYRKALSLHDQHNIEDGCAEALGNLGSLSLIRGDLEKAVAPHRQSLGLFEAAEDAGGVAMQLNSLGNVALAKGGIGEARKLFEDGLALHSEIDDPLGMGLQFNGLGRLDQLVGQDEAADLNYGKALDCFARVGHKANLAMVHGNRGMLFMKRGDALAARHEMETAIELWEFIGNDRGIANASKSLGDIYVILSESDEKIRSAYMRAMKLFEVFDDEEALASIHVGLGNAAAQDIRVPDAIGNWTIAADMYRKMGYEKRVRHIEEAIRGIWTKTGKTKVA